MSLEIEEVRVAYGRTDVLFGVTLSVPEGSLTCLMGRNGVGKSTLLNTVMGLLPLRGGAITFEGKDLRRMAPYQRARAGIGYVPQGHQVFPQLTAWENLQVIVERDKHGSFAAVDEALDVFPALRDLLSRPAGLLSGGQAQQLAIARALVTRPKLLVLDEPTEGIQPSIIAEIEDAIAELHRRTNMSILLVEQYVEFAMRLSQQYAVMEGGVITHSGDSRTADMIRFAGLLGV